MIMREDIDNMPLVSVVIPTYKRSDYLTQAIDSVLSQTYKNIEIIVVDDNGKGTADQVATEEKLRQYIRQGKVKYIAHEVNKNGSAARNTGFRASSGVYINFLDDDDELYGDKILKQVECLDNSSQDVGANYCNVVCLDSQKNLVKGNPVVIEGKFVKDYILETVKFNTSAILFKRECLIRLNGFDETYCRHQDWELMMRFFRYYNISCAGVEPLMVYDRSKDRQSLPNVKRQVGFTEKFMREFKTDLVQNHCYEEFVHKMFFWYCIASLNIKDYKTFRRAFVRDIRTKRMSFKQLGSIIKNLITSFV